MLVSGMIHSGHTNCANVGHGFHLPVRSPAVTFVCLLAKSYLGDMGNLCSVVCFGFDSWCCSVYHMLVGGMTHSGHTYSADVGHGFHLLVGSQAVTFERLLAEIHLGDMGCL